MFKNETMESKMQRVGERRKVVAMVYLGLPFGLACWSAGARSGAEWLMGLGALGFVQCAIGVLLLFRWSRYGLWAHMQRFTSRTAMRDWLHGDPAVMQEFDERERAVRDRAHVAAYTLYTNLVMLGLAWLCLHAVFEHGLQLSADQLQLACWVMAVITLTLPSAILAWTDAEARE